MPRKKHVADERSGQLGARFLGTVNRHVRPTIRNVANGATPLAAIVVVIYEQEYLLWKC